MSSEAQRTGQAAEVAAQAWLESQGVAFLASNFRSRYGEIDLIGLHRQHLVFFEIRFRQTAHFGGAAASITLSKQQKISRTAQVFMQQHPDYALLPCRFDVVAVTLARQRWQFQWLEQAFYGED